MTNNPVTKKTRQFFKKFPSVSFNNKENILVAGQKSAVIYFLETGLVKQQSTSPKGEVLILHQYRPGSFFSLHWLATGGQNDYVYQAVGQVKVTTAPLAAVKKFLQSEPDVAFQTLQRLSAGLDGLAHRLEILATDQAGQRISSLLNHLANRYGKPNKESVIIPFKLTHQDVASWVGVARETASLEMASLQKNGLIDHHGFCTSKPTILRSLLI